MAGVRTSAELVEVLVSGPQGVRTSGEYVEVVVRGPQGVRTSAEYVEVLVGPMPQDLLLTGIASAEIFGPINTPLRTVFPASLPLGGVGSFRVIMYAMPVGIESQEAFGTVAPIKIVSPVSIPSGEAFSVAGALGFFYDRFASLFQMPTESGSITTTNVGATMEPGEPASVYGTGTSTIWFRIVPEYDGQLVLDTYGSRRTDDQIGDGSLYPYQGLHPDDDLFMGENWNSSLDTVLEVYTGTSLADLVLVGANDDEPSGVGLWSALTVPVEAGTTYYVRVNAWDESLDLVGTTGFGFGPFGGGSFGS